MRLLPPLTALTICYVLFFTCVIASYSALPAKVASHFDLAGQPNGWMSRDSCVDFTLGLGIVVPAFIIVIMGGAGRIPVSFINLPHRDYWLAPERRRAALAVLRRYSLWLSCLLVLFVTGLHWLIVQANRQGQGPHLSGIGISVIAGGFVIGTGVWTVLLLRHFSKIT
jgi:hypothetical protein